jgi:hypothetical protein
MNSLKRGLGAVAGGTATLLLAFGCGSGVQSSAGSEFVPTVNAICDRIDARVEGLPWPRSDDEYVQHLIEVNEIQEQGSGELRAVTPPAAKQREFRKLIAEVEASAEALKQEAGAFQAGDLVAVRNAQAEFNASGKRFEGIARQLGVECG